VAPSCVSLNGIEICFFLKEKQRRKKGKIRKPKRKYTWRKEKNGIKRKKRRKKKNKEENKE